MFYEEMRERKSEREREEREKSCKTVESVVFFFFPSFPSSLNYKSSNLTRVARSMAVIRIDGCIVALEIVL